MNVLILNPKSGNAQDSELSLQLLRRTGMHADIALTGDTIEFPDMGKDDCLIVAGGDGTIRRYARCCAQRGCRLGVLPTGTGNVFARGLSLPLEPKAASIVLKGGSTKRIDVGLVNNEFFLNGAHIGMGSEISRIHWNRHESDTHC